MAKKDVLVLGGGIAGIEAVIQLRKKGLSVHLITNRDYVYIYPITIWLPTKEKKFEDVILKISDLAKAHNFTYDIKKVEKVNSKEVFLDDGSVLRYGENYDYLVIALGQEKLRPKGIEYTYSICASPEETLEYTKKFDELINKGSGKLAFGFGGNPKAKEAVRGGPVFEVLFNIDHYLRKKRIRDKFELTFFAPMPKPGARLGEKALKIMDMMFERKGIKKITGKKIKEFKENGILLEDDTFIESDLTLFTPAGDGHPAIKNSDDLPLTDAGFLIIDDYCRVEGFNYIYGIGDSASIKGPDWRAKQGHLAEVMAKATAHNIALDKGLIKGQPKDYIHHINIMCLMDTGDGGALAYRDDKKAILLPLPIIGHWMKKGWGLYYKLSKLGKIPRLPGM
jgi:sulfide:quinone oxidoreductase